MKNKIITSLFSFLILGLSSCRDNNNIPINSKTELEENLQTEFSAIGVPSVSYCVVKNDKVLHSGALGLADRSANRLATDRTGYLIASISKTVTAVALMKLVEQNLISLDDDINQHLPFSVRNPNFPNTPITYRMLLSHTSSISDDYQNNFDLNCFGVDCAMTLSQYFDEVFLSTGRYFSTTNFSNNEPGTNEDYSNLGSALVGYLVERITQTPFDVYCKNNIFTPLGMTKTEWRLANLPIDELAIPYPPNTASTNPHYTFPDYPNGGLRTNVLDLSIFLRMVIQNGSFEGTQILSSASMATMKTLQFGSADQCISFYYETFNGKRVLGHSGGEAGATAEMYYNTNTNVGVIVFSNEEDAQLDNIITMLFNYGESQ